MIELKLRATPTNAEIERLAAANPGYRFERGVDGTLLVSPTHSLMGLWNSKLNAALVRWNDALTSPGLCFDSSAGFTMPDNSLISPYGSWVDRDRWLDLTDDQRDSYAPIVPDLIIEIVSKSDRPGAV